MQPSSRATRSSMELPAGANRVEIKAAQRAGRRIKWDKFCKCIPGLATINAIFNMHQKSVYIKGLSRPNQDPKLQDAYHQRIINEPTWEQVALLVPVLGQIVVGISTAVNKSKEERLDNTPVELEHLETVALPTLEDFKGYTESYGCTPANMRTSIEEATAMNGRITALEIKVDLGGATREDLAMLLHYAIRDEGRSPRAQFILGKYFAKQDKATPKREGIALSIPGQKARFWLNEASLNGEPRVKAFLALHPKYKTEMPMPEDLNQEGFSSFDSITS